MSTDPRSNVTQLLADLSAGKQDALEELMPLVYAELRRLAGRYLRRERQNHTLQPTALVNEAYLKLVEQHDVRWQNRAHFFGVAAQAMRRILIDHARTHVRLKRGGGAQRVTLDESAVAAESQTVDLISLDQALTRLAAADERQARVVELRFFGGLSVEETGEVLGISPATVKREWSMAKAWLHSELESGRGG